VEIPPCAEIGQREEAWAACMDDIQNSDLMLGGADATA
jgi:hypothetical protein